VAAVDCGTNSTRLLVAGPGGDTLDRRMTITRLGQGVDRTGRLDPGAIRRTIAVLEEYRAVMDRSGVQRVRMTATSAARDATNRDDFFGQARAVVGVAPELLTGEEEGALSFAGATAELISRSAAGRAEGGPWLVADIGGGSTELASGGPGGPDVVRSLDMGCVRITERFLGHDPPTAAEVSAGRSFVAARLAEATEATPALRAGRSLVGLAGTVAALAAIEQRLERYDRDRLHHYRLTRAGVETLLVTLAGEPADDRRRRPGMERDRADVIVGGAIVLAELMRHFGFTRCLSSEADILDGLVATLRP
jgi:exopolyphosphatase/guanosine-5'-triphosphate,3'-diphosphate pyrophosphatase